MTTHCDASICSDVYSDRKCKCYPNLSNTDNVDYNSNQFCAFESDDGFVYPCDPGCCDLGCPGQCEEVEPRPPEATYTVKDTPKIKKVKNILVYWAIMTLFFLLLSVL